MANKDDINLSSNYEDFGDFDFNIDESGTKKDRVAMPSKIRSDYLPSMKSGFVDGLKRELASKMPYTAAAVDQVSSIYNEAKQMTQQFAAEATPLVRSIGRSTNRLMPLVRPFMPKGVYDKITGKLSQIPDEQGELSEEERQSQQISADINAAFQGSDANAQVRANMENVVGGMRHKATLGAIGGLLNQMQTTNKFLTTSLMAYMKKDLELQYRQLYTQRDIASTLRGTAKVLEAELKNITHNSGLPDMIKAKDFQRRTTKMDKVRDYTANFWKNLMGNFKENVLNQIKQGLEGVEMAASGGADMKEMMEEMEGKPLSLQNLIMKGMFRLGGGVLGSTLTGKIAKMGQTALGGMDSIFENFNNNLIRGVENYSRKDNMLGRFLSMFTPQRPENDTKVQNALAKNPTQPVQFDISTREAIITIIPGYLAKLNKLVEDIKDPNKEHEEQVYSTDERRFVGKSALNETAEGFINKFINPEVYGSTDHLAVVTTGRALHGNSAKKMRDWFEHKSNDGGGRTNRQLVERFFQNLVRSEQHYFDVEMLDAYVNDRDINKDIAEYVQMATDGLGGAARRIVKYILNSLKLTNGEYNPTAIRKYQKALDNAAPYYDTNAITEKFSVAMNDMSEEKRERIFALLEDKGLFNRKEGKLNLAGMNELTANKRSEIDIGDAVNSWTARKAVEDITRTEAFSVNKVFERGLDAVNGFATNVTNDAKNIFNKTKNELKGMASKGSVKMAALTGNFVSSVFGNEMSDAFKLMSGALIDRYKKANGVATVALDLALVSGNFSDDDLQIVRDFAEQSMKEKDGDKIAKMRVVAIGAIENQDLCNIFSEATAGIVTQKDAINHFGTMKQRINMLQEEEVFKKAQDTLKAKLTQVKTKGASVKNKIKAGYEKAMAWIGGKTAEVAKESIEAIEPESADTTSDKEVKSKRKGKVAAIAETVQEKAKEAGKSISEAMNDTLKAKADVNEVLVKGLDEYKIYVSTMDENITKIYTLLEKKLGNLTEEELTELHTKAQQVKEEMEAKQAEETKKKNGGFGKKLKSFLGGAIGMLNPFKSLNAAKIAAKYHLDTTPESAFHADFQTYFAYRKEMDVCMASLMSRKSIIANTTRGLLSGAGKIIGGTASGLGRVAKGMWTGGGRILGGALPALGYLGGGLIHGGAIALNGVKDIALAAGNRSWEMMKSSVKLGKRVLFGSGRRKVDKDEQWYDLYRKDEVGEEGWMGKPILSARKQKKGIFHVGPDGKSTGKILKTDDIAGPVMDKKGKLLITQEDWDAGLVNIEGKSIAQKAKDHNSGGLIRLGGGSLLGGLFSGVGSLLGGGLKGAGSVLSQLIGINWDMTKMFSSGIKKTGKFLGGIGSNIAAALGIGTSEKAQRKKYSVIISEFEKVNKTLTAIKEEGLPTKKKKVVGDTDNDGDRDGSYEDQQKQEAEKDEKRSFKEMLLGLVGREKKDGKVVKKETPWWKRLYEFFTNPKGKFMLSLGAGGLILAMLAKKYGTEKAIEVITNSAMAAATAVNFIYDVCKKIYEFFSREPYKDPKVVGTSAALVGAWNTGTTVGSMVYHSNGATRARALNEVAKNRSAYHTALKKEEDARKAAAEAMRKAKEAEKLKKLEKLRQEEAIRRAKRAKDLKKLREAARTSPKHPPAVKKPPIKPNVPGSDIRVNPNGLKVPTPSKPGAPSFNRIWNAKTGKWSPIPTTPKPPAPAPTTKMGKLCKAVHDWLGKMWMKCWTGLDKAKHCGGRIIEWATDMMKWFKTVKSESALGWIFGIIAKLFKCQPDKITKAIKIGEGIALATVKSGKALFTLSKAFLNLLPGVGVLCKALGFVLKWIIGGLSTLFGCITKILVKADPKVSAIIGEFIQYVFDGWAIYCAYEIGDDNFMQEYYEAQYIFFGSKIAGVTLKIADIAGFMAAFGFHPGAVIYKAGVEIFRPVANMAISADIAIDNAKKSFDTVLEREQQLQDMYGGKIKSNEHKDFLSRLHQRADAIQPNKSQFFAVNEQSTTEKLKRFIPIYGQYKAMQDAGETIADAMLLNSKIAQRKEETKTFISEIVQQTVNNKYLAPKLQRKLLNLLEICITQQGYQDRHPWGVAVFWAIRRLSNNPADSEQVQSLRADYVLAEQLTTGEKKPNNTVQEGMQYVWSSCKEVITFKEVIDFMDSIIKVDNDKAAAEKRLAEEKARVAAEHKRRVAEQARQDRIRLVDDSISKSDNVNIKNIDDIFKDSKDTGVLISIAFEHADKVYADYMKDHNSKWPSNGVYEYGNAVFAFFAENLKGDEAKALTASSSFKPCGSPAAVALKKKALNWFSGVLKDKYKSDIHAECFGFYEDVDADMKGTTTWVCKHNGNDKLVSAKELHESVSGSSKIYKYAVVLKKTDIVPMPITTKVNTKQVAAAPPQGQPSKKVVPEPGEKGPKLVQPAPLPDSLKAKDKKKSVPATVLGNTLLPFEGETAEEYEIRRKEVEESYGEKIISYFTPFGKEAAFRFRKRQVDSGLEPDGIVVKTKSGEELYAKPMTPGEKEQTATPSNPTPEPSKAPSVTPESVKQQPAPAVKPVSMVQPELQQPPTKSFAEWEAKLNAVNEENIVLRRLIANGDTTNGYFKQIVDLLGQGNELTAAGNRVQEQQKDVFGRTLVSLGKQKPQVVVVPANGTQQQPPQTTIPRSPLNLQQMPIPG